MKLIVERKWFTGKSTCGELFVEGIFECFTLEDVVRVVKIPKETAIPTGTYKVIIDKSDRFKRLMPHILDVPGFTGIRIHPGNTDSETEGCLLVGRKRDFDIVTESKVAFDALFAKMQKASEITIEIV